MTAKKAPRAAAGATAPPTLAALVADPQNRRTHGAANLALIADSLKAVGAARSIVIDEDNLILAGNGVTQAAAQAGVTKLRVIEASGDEIIAVRRRGLTDAQKRALALYDNRTAELATWNVEQLLADQAAGLDLASFWDDDALAALLAANGAPKAGKTDPDAVPEVRATDIQRGDLFELGAHRLLCGDATDAGDVARVIGEEKALLVATDPPYLVDYDGTNRHGKAGKDWSSIYHEIDIRDAEGFIRSVFRNVLTAIAPHAAIYCWHAHKRAALIEAVWHELGILDHQQIVWLKPTAVFGRAYWPWQHEPCLMGWRQGSKPHHDGENSHELTSVWAIDWEGAARIVGNEHPTQKPVEIFARPMRKHTKVGSVCFEPFSGSGSQLIAAEQNRRLLRAIEIEPVFVQLALDRWEAFTGQRAVKVGAVTRHTVTNGRTKNAAAAPPQAAQPPARRGRQKARPRGARA